MTEIISVALITISKWCHSSPCFKEIGQCTLVAKVKIISYFSHCHIRLLQQITDFLVKKGGNVIIDRGTRYFFYHSGEISRRNIQFIGVKPDLSLTLEMAIQQMQKDFIHILSYGASLGSTKGCHKATLTPEVSRHSP